jgi:4-amino-4-deoxy-L-arabinose transferase-like glycosyltransferase
LRWVVLIGGLVTAVAVLGTTRLPARLAVVTAGVALTLGLAGPSAYAVQTASQAHTGSIPSAGPAVSGGGFGGGAGGGRGGGGFGGNRGGFPGGGFPGGGFAGGGTTAQGGATAQGGRGGGMRGGGGMGGLLDAVTPSAEMKTLLTANADQYTWVAAAVGSQSASGYQLATGKPVMAVGGFNGSDPSPTLAEFQADVAAGKIHYFIGGSGMGGGGSTTGGSNASAQIAAWVAANYQAQTVGSTTVYDLTS